MTALALPEAWGMCGCANEPALRLLRDILRHMAEEGPKMPVWPEPREAFEAWIHEHAAKRSRIAGGEPQWELFMHYIDHMGWSEHGGGINSSWLTGEGEQALKTLNSLDLKDPS